MRSSLTRDSLKLLMRELARSTRTKKHYRVYLVGGGTAVFNGWRESSIDADLYGEPDDIFHDVQNIKERLHLNIELVRPEDFVPPLANSADRHVLIETIGRVSYFHYDPYAQLFSKIVRGFDRDLADARAFIKSGMVNGARLSRLVSAIPEAAWSKYPRHSPAAVLSAVVTFLADQS